MYVLALTFWVPQHRAVQARKNGEPLDNAFVSFLTC